ncbi:hypothetical protein BCR34DRAFT_642957 [Clohesyomyces aquaticus]|uniref:ubiquitinyl hydrolase 1 n=1 Tax=Clohesyomyces aquaticus TaxID=1231657 RepID=A0A1Y1ZZI8_9PLEO|nr:hypothetical protein BCR34DRAFT_642957 [Clohesyomyces aquaticus]
MAALAEVFNHLALPRKLPGAQDIDLVRTNGDILGRLIRATKTLEGLAGRHQFQTWHELRHALTTCQNLHGLGRLEKRSLISEFQTLTCPLVLYITEQNAALIIRRVVRGSETMDVIVFEAFETSPPSADVLASEGALTWNFPDCAAQIPFSEFQKPSFQEALADFLEKASMESLKRFLAHTTKAQKSVVESRDTTSPGLVTHLLMPILEAIGSPADVNVPRLKKRVREEVNIQNSELPWRRAPFWLMLRVFTQRELQFKVGSEDGRTCYKFLVATLLVELLNQSPGQLAPELTLMLRGKICRRITKLQQEKAASPAVSNHLLAVAGPFFKDVIIETTKVVQSAWDNFKRNTVRPIPTLPSRAGGQELFLTLPNSGIYLQAVLNLPRTQIKAQPSFNLPSSYDGKIEQVEKFTNLYFKLSSLENRIEAHQYPESMEKMKLPTPENYCTKLAEGILNLFQNVGDAFDGNAEQTSIFILSLFSLWVRMDGYAAKHCPLLLEYRPAFNPELLDALHLPDASQMERLLEIQKYLRKRFEDCKHPLTVFDLNERSFAVNYVAGYRNMRWLLQQIQGKSEQARQAKKIELDRWCEKFDQHSLGVTGGTCVCTVNYDGTRSVKGCNRCWNGRMRARMEILAHEDFLPQDEAKAATVVFELGIPNFITAYRNATWKILKLAYPTNPTSEPPIMLLKDYKSLKKFGGGKITTGITIASKTKSFLGTHYRVSKKRMKATEADVFYPNALSFCYYDTASEAWINDFDKPLTFQHLCAVHVPRDLRVVIPESAHPTPEIPCPSSYEIVASENRCPPNTSINEFTAYQRLLSGKNRRWLTMLVELGASDVNFSSESTMLMFNHLAIQAGPAQDEPNKLRDCHVVFTDTSFCDGLGKQIRKRLRNIASNWREVHCMEVLITLTLRLFALALSKTLAEDLLKEAREITFHWIVRLRTDVRNTKDPAAAQIAARYAFWASLLCRRTFSTFLDSQEVMTADDLSIFVQASLGLQENLLIDLTKLPPTLKAILIRDTKMVYNLQALILRSINLSPHSVGAAINASWSTSQNSAGKLFSGWRDMARPHDRWVVSTMSTTNSTTNIQVVHYNFTEGHLLVDGKPLGTLPLEIRESNEVKELFGNQPILAFPSGEIGMSYVMATRVENQEIHFGERNGRVIIRTRSCDGLLEYIPPNLFTSINAVDFPLGLLENCAHFLNLGTKCIEIRRKPVLWKTRKNDWIIDVVNRRGSRSGRVSLVDPNSAFFAQVARIFQHFEDPRRITVYQPMKAHARLAVELRHLELSFFVNMKGLLQCKELGEEIDPNQDAGTLYGFQSKIVLRDVADTKRRSIIAPWGGVNTERHGMHVKIVAGNSPDYARFGIDDVLGRLSCPAEPRLLYAKALFHALTSFPIPDPLTGRTGTEEALHILQSGYCQPWTPLGNSPIETLQCIGKLSPKRDYYPKDKKNLQTVSWDANLTMYIQHDAYEGIVRDILDKSERLRVFSSFGDEDVQVDNYTPTHLRKRGMAQHSLYERQFLEKSSSTCGDKEYVSRGQQANSAQASKAYHIAKLLNNRPFSIHTTQTLSAILQGWSLIGGFHATAETVVSLSDLTEKNVAERWGSLVNTFRNAGAEDLYSSIFQLCLMSSNPETDMNIIKIFVAFASLQELKELEPTNGSAFSQFKLNQSPTEQSLFKVISVDFPEKPSRRVNRAQEEHLKRCEDEGRRLARHLLRQWPQKDVSLDGFNSDTIDTALAMDRIIPEWLRLQKNMKLSGYVLRVEGVLNRYKGPTVTSMPTVWNLSLKPGRTPDRTSAIRPTATELLSRQIPTPLKVSARDKGVWVGATAYPTSDSSGAKAPSSEATQLRKILSAFTSSSNSLRQHYGRDLETSLNALEKCSFQKKNVLIPPNTTIIEKSIYEVREVLKNHWLQMRDALSANDDRFQWLELAHLWPLHSSMAILEQLRSNSHCSMDRNVKESIASHGMLVTLLQRLLRIRNLLYHPKNTKLQEELGNTGHENWDPMDFPDWLLLEVDSDLLIRPEQIDVAHAIIKPESRKNTALQLNMGKGKTSCIVPMAMAILGNGEQLARLIVPKPLLLPTAQMIQSRLGGLVGREIMHIPFSRRTKPSPDTLKLYADLHRDMLHRCGVVLNAPDHILSYKLSGLQNLADFKLAVARDMIKFQSWLTSNCRDLLDESDASLAVKTQLIYPSGEQVTVDGHPHRWQVAQSLLDLIKDYLPELQRKFPKSVEVIKRGHGYPMIHFLQPDVEEDLHRRIIAEVCTGKMPFLRFGDTTTGNHGADIRKVLVDPELAQKSLKRVAGFFVDKGISSKILLLIRGLLRNRILLLCLKKRWNVQYGLHPNRDPIAVPFEAKSVPSEQAEFGHPDAAILFTCLAFYYSGLTLAQFSEGLRHVLASADPSSEYDRWTSSCQTLPAALSHFNVINVDDQVQLAELWKHLRACKSVLDHYMNNVVFPVHAKQFGIKLQASGWDLPLFSKLGSESNASGGARTTGFSGTNDNKMMLPLTIHQDDLPSLHQTNAEVLTYLLEPRNREYCLASRGGRRLSEEDFLTQLKVKGIRVLIDAGAHILEMGNEDLVKTWQAIDTEPLAAVYFGADNRAWVRYRGTKKPVPLLASAFVDNLDNCLIYIDEAHTRGIDLKLPQTARGALTLALGQTKDHTVQAAMRLRQLATTQSVCFFASPETHQSILDVCKLHDKAKVDSSHVVHWLLEQTCRGNEQLQNLYIAQGADFCSRTAAEWENSKFLSDAQERDAYVKVLQHPEQQTLEQLYGHHVNNTSSAGSPKSAFPQIQAYMRTLCDQRYAASSNTSALHSFALEEVEQEREVEFQVEEVREVQRPVYYKALTFPGLHPAISAFARKGVLSGDKGYENVFTAVSRTSIGEKFDFAGSDTNLFVSAEFMKTIEMGQTRSVDNFLRPVEWILYSRKTSTAIILISEEVEILIPRLRAQKKTAGVHLLTYSAPITKKMLHFSGLKYYALPALPVGHVIPPWLTIEVGIFAGRLYLDFDECAPLVEYIGNNENGEQSADAATKATSFLIEWLSLRRKGQDIMHTPVGYVCQGRPLHSEQAFFITHGIGEESNGMSYEVGSNDVDEEPEESEEEDDE